MGNAPPQCCPGVKKQNPIVHDIVEALDLADGTLEKRCARYKFKEATVSLIKWREAQKDGKRAIAKSLEILFDSKVLFNQEVLPEHKCCFIPCNMYHATNIWTHRGLAIRIQLKLSIQHGCEVQNTAR